MKRGELLRITADLITKDRNETHGDPVAQLGLAATLKRTLNHRANERLTSAEIEAIDMICTKLSRLAKGKPILDHYMDIAGYAAIAAEARGEANGEEDELEQLEKIAMNLAPTHK